MRIAVLATCLADALFPPAAIATVQLLERLGHEVVFPRGQTCCGQMHINTGYFAEATALVRHHVEVFEDADCDAVVAPSGSCVGSVRHQPTCHSLRMLRVGDKPLELLRPRNPRKSHVRSPRLIEANGPWAGLPTRLRLAVVVGSFTGHRSSSTLVMELLS
jgi:L-lactate dehydrogenase complex protein LldE